MNPFTIFRRMVRVLARPVSTHREIKGEYIQTYRGYGTKDQIFLIGRVIRQMGPFFQNHTGFLADLVDVIRRLFRKGVRDGKVQAVIHGKRKVFTTDRHGYFHVRMAMSHLQPRDDYWENVEIELVNPGNGFRTQEQVYIPSQKAQRIIVSDIDDTVVYTGVAHKIKMLWRVYAQGAEARTAFPGVGQFYKALHDGALGDENNPVLYLSRAPWSIYEVLDEFFREQILPDPVLLLREWGMTITNPIPSRGRGHKLEQLRETLEIYDDKEFVLIGDSGQHDTETYARVVEEFPGRVSVIYIRDVSHDQRRSKEIQNAAEKIAGSGTSLFLTSDTFAMAEHALDHGLISEESLDQVLRERNREKQLDS